jgi:hypothetical protein
MRNTREWMEMNQEKKIKEIIVICNIKTQFLKISMILVRSPIVGPFPSPPHNASSPELNMPIAFCHLIKSMNMYLSNTNAAKFTHISCAES